MKFTLEIDCDNAAFEAGPDWDKETNADRRNQEVARILSGIAYRFHAGDNTEAIILCDLNGNKVGHCDFFND